VCIFLEGDAVDEAEPILASPLLDVTRISLDMLDELPESALKQSLQWISQEGLDISDHWSGFESSI